MPHHTERVDVCILYFEGCPNWILAAERVSEAVRLLGRGDVDINFHRVDTDQEAQEIGFLGSPTILLDGVDAFPVEGQHPVGLACRRYPMPEGLDGAPTVAQLVDVLSARADR